MVAFAVAASFGHCKIGHWPILCGKSKVVVVSLEAGESPVNLGQLPYDMAYSRALGEQAKMHNGSSQWARQERHRERVCEDTPTQGRDNGCHKGTQEASAKNLLKGIVDAKDVLAVVSTDRRDSRNPKLDECLKDLTSQQKGWKILAFKDEVAVSLGDGVFLHDVFRHVDGSHEGDLQCVQKTDKEDNAYKYNNRRVGWEDCPHSRIACKESLEGNGEGNAEEADT